MKKSVAILFSASALAAGCSQEPGFELIQAENFTREVNGRSVTLYTLKAGDIALQTTNFGARVVSIFTPDRSGKYEDIALGYKNLDNYINNPGERFLGAVVGPYANRIADGTFSIDGQVYQLPQNDNGNTLHSGDLGVDMVVWDVEEVTDKSIVYHYVHPDGWHGYPGNIDIRMTYSVTDENEFKVDYLVTTDKTTHINMSHHSFFNLKGEGNGTILDEVMMINSSKTTAIDNKLIPTGEIVPVEGTPFDFRNAHEIGQLIDQDNDQLKNGKGYDHNWILDRKSDNGIELAVTVYEPSNGRYMEVFTDQPALQFYCGNFFDGTTNGKYGKALNYRESIALETQKYPDTPHHDNFPSTLLKPGETYTHHCVYKFSVK